MDVTILLHGTCPCCGYRNQGVRIGRARPGMRTLRVAAPSIIFTPDRCEECRHPIGLDLYDTQRLDADTTARLRAWRQRQQTRRQKGRVA